MKSITEKAKFCKRVVEYAIKENNNAKAARRYQTTRQQVKRWRDKYDGTVKSLVYKSKRPKSHPNQHIEQEIKLIMKKYKSKPNVEKAKYPGEKVQIDIKYIPKECIKFGPKDKNYYQITAIDEYTRKRVLAAIDEKST